MKILLPQVLVIDPPSPHNGKTVDILLSDGAIEAIGLDLDQKNVNVIEAARGRMVSPGWIDGRARSGEPGHEERETYSSLAFAAAQGGFTQVAVMPSTTPPRDARPHIESLIQASQSLPVALLPIGSISKRIEGEHLAELTDMHLAGAVGFSDDVYGLDHAHLLQLALQYAQDMDVSIQSFAFDRSINPNGQAHEGAMALSQGLSPISILAESLRVQRDLAIHAYAGGRLHIAGLSTVEAVEMVRSAKANGQDVTADVAIANLIGTEADIQGFDSTYKVLPPLRSLGDKEALWGGLLDGTIDMVVSDHNPMDTEAKSCEWGQALFGAATIEHAFGWYHHVNASHEALERWIEAVAYQPRKLYQLGTCTVKVGMPADLTIFTLDGSAEQTHTKAMNTPSWTQNGRAIGIVRGKKVTLL